MGDSMGDRVGGTTGDHSRDQPVAAPTFPAVLFCCSHGQPCGSDCYQHHSDGSPAAVEGACGRSGELRHCPHTLLRWVSAGLHLRQVGMAGIGAEYSMKVKKKGILSI